MKRRAVSRAQNHLNRLVARNARPRAIKRAEVALESRQAAAEARIEREAAAEVT